MPRRGVPSWDQSSRGDSARDGAGKRWARPSVAALLEIHGGFSQIPAPPHWKLHVPVDWTTASKSPQLRERSGSTVMKLKAHTLHGSRPLCSSTLVFGYLSHRTWNTEEKQQLEKKRDLLTISSAQSPVHGTFSFKVSKSPKCPNVGCSRYLVQSECTCCPHHWSCACSHCNNNAPGAVARLLLWWQIHQALGTNASPQK